MLVGRKKEYQLLRDAYDDEYSRLVVVYGRKRIGKTFLVSESFDRRFCFYHCGIIGENSKEAQLGTFMDSLADYGHKCDKLSSWIEAFSHLKDVIRESGDGKKVVFLDEIASMDTINSGFIHALEQFWNGWCNLRKDVLLVISSSSTSWILKKVLRNHGGLYNRVSLKIHLHPFTLSECEEYMHSEKKLDYVSRYDILTLYMAIGGVPYYWSLLDRGLSAGQNIDSLFFGSNARLDGEFDSLYRSLYRSPGQYITIITALGKKAGGLTRAELASTPRLDDSGNLTEKLEDLEMSDIIRMDPVYPHAKKGAIYRIIDPFTLFHLTFASQKKKKDSPFWQHSINSSLVRSWCGLAFERVCLLHVDKIKEKLGISGVQTTQWAWRGEHAQIDLVIDRKDNVMNICEMKWSGSEYTMDAKDHKSILNKIEQFSHVTDRSKSIQATMITTYGVKKGMYFDDYQSEVTLDDLF